MSKLLGKNCLPGSPHEQWLLLFLVFLFEPSHHKTNKMTRAPSEDSDWADAQADQSLHSPHDESLGL